MKLIQTIVMLLLLPWWMAKACVMSAVGVSLIVARQILDVWAGHPKLSQPAQRKPL